MAKVEKEKILAILEASGMDKDKIGETMEKLKAEGALNVKVPPLELSAEAEAAAKTLAEFCKVNDCKVSQTVTRRSPIEINRLINALMDPVTKLSGTAKQFQ